LCDENYPKTLIKLPVLGVGETPQAEYDAIEDELRAFDMVPSNKSPLTRILALISRQSISQRSLCLTKSEEKRSERSRMVDILLID
jgi:hypothetical protein